MTSLKFTGLILGLLFTQLINFTAGATIPPTQESSSDIKYAVDLISFIIGDKTTDAPTTVAPAQESLKHNISSSDLIPTIIDSKTTDSPTTIGPIKEVISDNITAGDLFSLIIGGISTDAPDTVAPPQEALKQNITATDKFVVEDKSREKLAPTKDSENENLVPDDLISFLFGSNSKEGEIYTPPTSTAASARETSSHNLFAADLFSVLVKDKSTENIVYSPASIQTCLALAFIGAEGETAKEMRKVLRLGDGDKQQVAENYREFLKTLLKVEDETREVPKLKMANRLYVNGKLEISLEFQKIAQEYFETHAEAMNFTDNTEAVKKINNWIEQQTENKIRDLLKENALNEDTNAVLVNAIYYKAKWLNPFSLSSTSASTFHVNLNDRMEAEIMYNEDYYGYADLPDLKASVLEMPYENSDISMLIILPNDIEGLANLEFKLRDMDLNDITSKISYRNVHAYVPKFRIEFDIDLKEPLEKLGLTTTFSSSANFKGLFSRPELQSTISEVKHKAFLDVNEAGSEAAAATFATLTTLSAVFDEPIFRADHPFVFAIRSKSVVYFAGHVAKM